jgi:hypothetical protein
MITAAEKPKGANAEKLRAGLQMINGKLFGRYPIKNNIV